VHEEHKSDEEGEQRQVQKGGGCLYKRSDMRVLDTLIQKRSNSSSFIGGLSPLYGTEIVGAPLLNESGHESASNTQSETEEPKSVYDDRTSRWDKRDVGRRLDQSSGLGAVADDRELL
jgi:hypothetical protein